MSIPTTPPGTVRLWTPLPVEESPTTPSPPSRPRRSALSLDMSAGQSSTQSLPGSSGASVTCDSHSSSIVDFSYESTNSGHLPLLYNSTDSPGSPDSPDTPGPLTPSTPASFGPTRPASARVRGVRRSRRKPVPSVDVSDVFVDLSPENPGSNVDFSSASNADLDIYLQKERERIYGARGDIRPSESSTHSTLSLGVPVTAAPTEDAGIPPRYILPVDPPMRQESPPMIVPCGTAHRSTYSVSSTRSPAAPASAYMLRSSTSLDAERVLGARTYGDGSPRQVEAPTLGFLVEPDPYETLPRYARETGTEPPTVAGWAWRWGFLFPPLWILGIVSIWSPLRLTEEPDPAKMQMMEEMAMVMRVTEIKYGKRCAVAFCVLTAALALAAALAVVLSKYT